MYMSIYVPILGSTSRDGYKSIIRAEYRAQVLWIQRTPRTDRV